MALVEIVLIALGLAMDAFAVSIAAGTLETTRGFRPTFRLAFHFGLFQFLMPVIGWFAGMRIAASVEAVDHWIAFGLLAFVGIRMIRSALDPEPGPQADPSRGMLLVTLSVATSIDAMAIGFTLAMLRVDIWYPSAVIGLITGLLCALGVRLGERLGARFGRRMSVAGGVVLILIGLRILVSHLVP
ncbi:MAG: manganese efflux pump MntP family protein [Candidatus Methylomirabilota bacterium]